MRALVHFFAQVLNASNVSRIVIPSRRVTTLPLPPTRMAVSDVAQSHPYSSDCQTLPIERQPAKTTWHRVLSFQEHSNKYLLNLKKGSKVYVEANFELREPEPEADPSTPQGQRQIFLRHGKFHCSSHCWIISQAFCGYSAESIRVLAQPKPRDDSEGGNHEGF